jgi:hypothetical protein
VAHCSLLRNKPGAKIKNKHDLDPKKAQTKSQALKLCYRYLKKKRNVQTNDVFSLSQTCSDKTVMVVWENNLRDVLKEGITGFQLFELRAPNSSMAPSYESVSD